MNKNLAIRNNAIVRTMEGEGFKEQLAYVMGAGPEGARLADRLVRMVVNEIQRTPQILKCTPESVYLSAMQCARLRLEPGMDLAFLIPRGGVCHFQVGYRGHIQLLKEFAGCLKVECGIVHENDKFRRAVSIGLGDSPEGGLVFEHEAPVDGRGEPTRVYCLAWMDTGVIHHDVMTKAEVEHVRDTSKARSDAWDKYPLEMWKKTVINRLWKRIPMSPELAIADKAEMALQVGLEPTWAGIPVNPESLAQDATKVLDNIVAEEQSQVETIVQSLSEGPPRKRSSKLIAKDLFLETAMEKAGMGKDKAIVTALDFSRCDDSRTMTEEDWTLNTERIIALTNYDEDTPEEAADETPSDPFQPRQPFVPPTGEVKEETDAQDQDLLI